MAQQDIDGHWDEREENYIIEQPNGEPMIIPKNIFDLYEFDTSSNIEILHEINRINRIKKLIGIPDYVHDIKISFIFHPVTHRTVQQIYTFPTEEDIKQGKKSRQFKSHDQVGVRFDIGGVTVYAEGSYSPTGFKAVKNKIFKRTFEYNEKVPIVFNTHDPNSDDPKSVGQKITLNIPAYNIGTLRTDVDVDRIKKDIEEHIAREFFNEYENLGIGREPLNNSPPSGGKRYKKVKKTKKTKKSKKSKKGTRRH